MGLVNLKEIFREDTSIWAVGAFNVHNLEFIRAVVEEAEELRSPVVLAVAPISIRYMSLELLGSAAIEAARRARIPVAVHLDHARDMELVHRALEMGFSSVMLDGSSLPLNQNIDLTGQVIQVARAAGATAEGEVGIMGHADRGDTGVFSDPDQAVLFAQETGVDFLAVSVGSIHGMKTQKARLNMELLEILGKTVPCPMVLHGSTGVVDDDIRGAIRRGVRKINIGTGLKVSFTAGIKEALMDEGLEDPMHYLTKGIERVRRFVAAKMQLLGSAGKA